MVAEVSQLGFARRQSRFAERMAGADPWDARVGTIVVVPSITFPAAELRKIVGIVHYEERLLCTLLHLSDPALQIVYVTSVPINEAIVSYYLSFLPDPDDAARRLHLVTLDDPAIGPLTSKLLEAPAALKVIKRNVADPDEAYLLTFNSTSLEQRLADELEIPLFGPDPSLVPLGSKSGARRVAAAAGVPVLTGSGDLFSLDEVAAAIAVIGRWRPDAVAAVVKLNNGFSGQGNAIIEMSGVASPLEDSVCRFCAKEESWSSYSSKISQEGAIVEELIRRPGTVSPSVQMRIAPDATFEVLSTHDQILGGPDDQVYLGCRFPARPSYRAEIQDLACRVAEVLAKEGVIGSFGIDFVVLPERDGRDIYLSEINLRMGGTTHPFMMARLVTGGTYDRISGDLLADGRSKHYVGTDNLKDPAFEGLSPEGVIGIVSDAGLAFDAAAGTGVTLHLLGTVTRHGKLGAVCIADSHEDAEALHDGLVAALRSARVPD